MTITAIHEATCPAQLLASNLQLEGKHKVAERARRLRQRRTIWPRPRRLTLRPELRAIDLSEADTLCLSRRGCSQQGTDPGELFDRCQLPQLLLHRRAWARVDGKRPGASSAKPGPARPDADAPRTPRHARRARRPHAHTHPPPPSREGGGALPAIAQRTTDTADAHVSRGPPRTPRETPRPPKRPRCPCPDPPSRARPPRQGPNAAPEPERFRLGDESMNMSQHYGGASQLPSDDLRQCVSYFLYCLRGIPLAPLCIFYIVISLAKV